MINHTVGSVYVVTDSSKIGRHFNFSSGDIDKVSNLITDEDITVENVHKFQNAGIKVSIVNYNK